MEPLDYRTPGTPTVQQQPTAAIIAAVAGGVLLLAAIAVRIWAPGLLGTRRLQVGGGHYFEGQANHDAAVDVAWFLAIAGAIILGVAIHTLVRRPIAGP